MPDKKSKSNNLGQKHRAVTQKLHLRHDPDVSRRFTTTAHRQNTAYNRTIQDLWRHPNTPLKTSKAKGDHGLYSKLLEWRKPKDTPELALGTTRSVIARGGIAQAKAAMSAFDESLERDTQRITKSIKDAETENAKLQKLIDTDADEARRLTAEKIAKRKLARVPAKPWHDKPLHYEKQGNLIDGIEQPAWTHGAIPRSVQRRDISLERLLRNQTEIDRSGRNIIRIDEKPEHVYTKDPKTKLKKLEKHLLQIPGIGRIKVRESIPEDWDLRSLTIVEVTHRRPGSQDAQPHERSWEVHLQRRIPAPLRVDEETITDETAELHSVGSDAGVVQRLTTSSSKTGIEHHNPGARAATKADIKPLQRRRQHCRRGSRRYNELLARENAIRKKAIRIRDHDQRMLANKIAKTHDVVGVDDLPLANMMKSARGTTESPGANVKPKQGLNRSLAGVAPGRQNAEIEAACIRHGTVFQRVNPWGTSSTCSQCGHKDGKSRRSQSKFACTPCGYTANADANAAENGRQRAVRQVTAIARARIKRREKKLAESTASTESAPGTCQAAEGESPSAPGSANGTAPSRERRCRGRPGSRPSQV